MMVPRSDCQPERRLILPKFLGFPLYLASILSSECCPHKRRRIARALPPWLALLALSALFFTPDSAWGFETDQYLTWSVELQDSSPALNQFVNLRFERVLERLNRKPRSLECQEVSRLLYQDLVGTLLTNRLRGFLHDSADIDRFPDNQVSYWQYRRQSVFRRKAFPMLLPMSRTVRVGDVYLGTDKLGHFFAFGRRYYKRFVAARRRGESEQDALRNAVLWGLRMERTMVGGWADGIVSHADLEANYQGMALARAMCEGTAPLLERQDSGDYRLRAAIDLRDWITPNLDESWNGNHYMYYRWRLVRPILQAEVCPRSSESVVQARFERYREIAHDSPSMEIIEQFYSDWGRRPQDRHSLANVCSRSPPAERIAAEGDQAP
jgi:hypothetical protein